MNELVKKLCDTLNFNKKIKYEHEFSGQLLPFFTRNPERMKFTNGFSPVIGVISRIINGEDLELQIKEFDISNTSLETSVDESTVNRMFSPNMYRDMRSSKLLQYLPLSSGKARKGEIRIGEFLVDLLNLKENTDFIDMFKSDEASNLYEKIIFESLEKNKDSRITKNHNFRYYDNRQYFSKYFNSDIKHFKNNEEYFYAHIGELLEFYYLTYVIQTTIRISNGNISKDDEVLPVFFNLGNESVSQSRKAIQQGYNMVYQHGQGLLMDTDILNYLNVLIPDDSYFYWKNEILSDDFIYREQLLSNLKEFVIAFSEQLNGELLSGIDLHFDNLDEGIKSLRLLLETRNDKSPDSRFAKSLSDIVQQNYSRNHGRLGKALSLSNETILMLTSAIVGREKMLLNTVFQEFEHRGVFFDRITKNKVINLYEQANILEKLSDSGDAQYVRGIL